MWGKTPPEEELDLTPATIVPPLSEITEAIRKQMIDFPDFADFTPKFPKVGVGYLRMEARRNGDELP